MDGATLVPNVKPGATVLGSVSVGGKEYPVLTVWKHGDGRVATLTTRTTWRWSLVPGEKEQASFVYQQFWKNMVLWLTHSEQYKTVRVAIDGKLALQGEKTVFRVWVYDEYFKPLNDVEVFAQITKPDESQEPLAFHPVL